MRDALKAVARTLALIGVSPVLAYYWIIQQLGAGDRALEGCSQALALLPGLLGQYLRRAFFTHTLDYCASTAVISFGVVLSAPGTRIGRGAYIGPFCTIGLTSVEDDVLISAGAQVPTS